MRGTTRIGLTAADLGGATARSGACCCDGPTSTFGGSTIAAHFWLVFGTALISAVLAYATGEAAVTPWRCATALRLARLLVLGRLPRAACAGDSGRLARQEQHRAFAIATPVGVAIGSVFAALSTRELSGDSAVRNVRDR